jgi:hypothetical protein
MPQKCFIKPNRTKDRPFSERDVARVMCRVVRAGGSRARIETEYKKVCLNEKPKKSQAEEALEQGMQALEANTLELENAWNLFNLTNEIVALLVTLIPLFRLLRVASQLLRLGRLTARLGTNTVSARMDAIRQQQAANAEVFKILQQAAANEARFRLTGTR